MKSPIKFTALIVIAALLGFILWRRYVMRTPEYLIRKTIADAAEAVSRQDGETNSANAFKMLSLSRYMDDEIALGVHGLPIDGTFGREEFVSQIARGRMMLRRLEVTPVDILIIALDSQKAVVECEVRADAESAAGSGVKWKSDNIYHLKMEMRKVEDRWVFHSFRESDILEK